MDIDEFEASARLSRRGFYVTLLHVRWAMLTRRKRRRIWRTEPLLASAPPPHRGQALG